MLNILMKHFTAETASARRPLAEDLKRLIWNPVMTAVFLKHKMSQKDFVFSLCVSGKKCNAAVDNKW